MTDVMIPTKNSQENVDRTHYLMTNQCYELAHIYDDHCGLCIWIPEQNKERDDFARELAEGGFHYKQIVSPDTVMDEMGMFPDRPGSIAMKKWIAELVEIFATLFGLSRVGLRISSQEKPMCPKFHFDRIPVRLIYPLWGDGCQWFADPAYFQHQEIGHLNHWVVRAEQCHAPIHKAPKGAVVVMKGSTWKEGQIPVIHRSPSHINDRCVMTLDFA